MNSTRRSAFSAGFLAVAPIVPGIIPFGMISGATAVKAGLPPALAMGMSLIIFAGAAQLAAVQLLASGALPLAIVFTAWVINLRLAMYSASIAPHFRHLPTRWRWALAYLLTDQSYAMSVNRYMTSPLDEAHKHWFYLGTATTLWLVWQPATAAGILLGAAVPTSWSLDFAIPVTFLALLVPGLRDRPSLIAALVGGGVAVVTAPLPFNLGLVLAALCGIAAGLMSETMLHRRQRMSGRSTP